MVSRFSNSLTAESIHIAIKVQYQCHFYSNYRCKENKLLPLSLKFWPMVQSLNGYNYNIMEKK